MRRQDFNLNGGPHLRPGDVQLLQEVAKKLSKRFFRRAKNDAEYKVLCAYAGASLESDMNCFVSCLYPDKAKWRY